MLHHTISVMIDPKCKNGMLVCEVEAAADRRETCLVMNATFRDGHCQVCET